MSPTYVSRRGRAPLRLAGLARLAAGVVVVLVAVVGIVAALGRSQACRVGDVRLSTGEAEQAAAAVARVIQEGGGQAAARRALTRSPGLSAGDARTVALALGGRTPAALTCDHGGGAPTSDRLLPSGLTARAEKIRLDLRAHWPGTPLGGFAPGGVHTGHMKGSAHYEGRAIDCFFRPMTPENRRLGWALAQYFVAMAERFHIATVIFDDRIWTAARADEGWRHYQVDVAGKSAATAAILQHRDHVHVDVPR